MASRVVEIDHGWKAFVKTMKSLEANPVEAAVGYPAGNPSAAVAGFQEYGTERIPSRPFMRNTFDAERDNLAAAMAKGAGQIVDGAATPGEVAGDIGDLHREQIKNTINSGVGPANAPSTVAAKGSRTPLVDTGEMRDNIEVRVRGKTT